ncbi:MAG TPA: type III polyketide synthase [Planctomycetaceae bacterium]|nr:type III polyketide synthase [Planctomycetaceae bacterium]
MLTLNGIGTAVPPHSITQAQAAELARQFCAVGDDRTRVLPTLYRRAGIVTRRSVLLEGEENPQRQSFFAAAEHADDGGPTTGERMQRYASESGLLGMEASAKALQAAACDPSEITHLVTASCSGFHAPGFDIALIKRLGLPADVARTHVGFMGCHGAINALRVAQAYGTADRCARILVCAVELCSLHLHYGWDPDKMVANSLFADGAAAVVLRANQDETDGWRLSATRSVLFPDSEDAMTWKIGDHGFEMTLSPKVPDLIETHLADWLRGWLGTHGLSFDQVATWAVHPGGPRILAAVEEALGLDRAALTVSREVLSEFGNMSSPTILFILDRLRQRQAPRPCVALGFGPGLVAEAALLM